MLTYVEMVKQFIEENKVEGDKIIEKLTKLGWKLEGEAHNTKLTRVWDLTKCTSSGNYKWFAKKYIVTNTYIEYAIYPYINYVEFTVWYLGKGKENGERCDDDYEEVLDLALKDELFKEVGFPEFKTVLDSRNFLQPPIDYFCDLCQITENYESCLNEFKKGTYFIHIIKNNNIPVEKRSTYYYPITEEDAKSILESNNPKELIKKIINKNLKVKIKKN